MTYLSKADDVLAKAADAIARANAAVAKLIGANERLVRLEKQAEQWRADSLADLDKFEKETSSRLDSLEIKFGVRKRVAHQACRRQIARDNRVSNNVGDFDGRADFAGPGTWDR